MLDIFLEEMSSSLPPSAYNIILGLKKYFNSTKSLMLASFWFKVLSCIDQKKCCYSKQGITLNVEISLMEDLLTELQLLRDNPDSIIEEAKLVAKELIKVPSESPKRRKKSTDQSNSDFSVNKGQENKFIHLKSFPTESERERELSLIHI